MTAEERLSWRGAVRVGDTLRRPPRTGSELVTAFLHHLRRVGVDAAPGPLGLDDQGRAVFGWVDGAAGGYPLLSAAAGDAALASVAGMVRAIHDASQSFAGPSGGWDDLLSDPSGPAEVICHNDLSPANTVLRGERPVALVDWEFAAPGSRLWDLAYAAWWWVPLHRPECAATLGWPPRVDQPRRLRLLCDAYGLDAPVRRRLLDVIHDRQLANQRQLALWVRDGLIPLFDDADPSIDVGRTDYVESRRDELLVALG